MEDEARFTEPSRGREIKSLSEQWTIALKIRDEMAESFNAGRSDATVRRAKRQRKELSPRINELFGEITVASAWVEEAASTLLQNKNDWTTRIKGYGESRKELLKGLRRAGVPEGLIDRMNDAFEKRHFVVHGIGLQDVGSAELLMMKHQPTNGDTKELPPQRETRSFTMQELRDLVDELWSIEDQLKGVSDQARRDKSALLSMMRIDAKTNAAN